METLPTLQKEIVLWNVHRLSEKSFKSLMLQDLDCEQDLAVGTLWYVGSEEPFWSSQQFA